MGPDVTRSAASSTISSTTGHRHGEALAARPHRERLDDRDGQRHANDERRAAPRRRFEHELAAEPLHDLAHDVHSEAATARRVGLRARREPGAAQKLEQVGLVGRHRAACLFRHRRAIDAGAVVRDSKLDAAIARRAVDRERRRLGLASANAVGGQLDPVIDCVSHQMHERRKEPLGDRLVELGGADVEVDAHLLAVRPREAAHDERQALEHARHPHHPHAEDRGAELAQLARVVGHDRAELAEISARAFEALDRERHPRAGHDERAEELDRVVDARDLDAKDAARSVNGAVVVVGLDGASNGGSGTGTIAASSSVTTRCALAALGDRLVRRGA